MKKSKTTLRRTLGIVLVQTFNAVYTKSQDYFKEFGMTSQQYNVLSILAESPEALSTSAILEKMVEKNAGVSRLVDRLLAKGLVKKKTSKTDKRLIAVTLTPEGTQLLAVMNSRLEEIDQVYSALTDAETTELIRLLQKIS
ncbi:MarR family winged helix-turn-helix transcriptional regulator [Chitinophaga sp. Cy-1792]|uniref:MarR family winged helix-turn-helix transcriptional regulator n=1 Tax=Chitinophaga sp. Cy-1792 TaxID=2608339 RepID=UPI001422B45E|nr:MarR family transcriptional regulator [Chitinophaga sp. Cy-1792]NIG55814.1 MarR family transcriptional regulator [Chitinophaga sp. Cy-1792]